MRLLTGVAGDFQHFKTDVVKSIGILQHAADQANERYVKEVKERKRLHNLVAELKGNIRVFCRVRPANKDETACGDKIGISAQVSVLRCGVRSIRCRLPLMRVRV